MIHTCSILLCCYSYHFMQCINYMTLAIFNLYFGHYFKPYIVLCVDFLHDELSHHRWVELYNVGKDIDCSLPHISIIHTLLKNHQFSFINLMFTMIYFSIQKVGSLYLLESLEATYLLLLICIYVTISWGSMVSLSEPISPFFVFIGFCWNGRVHWFSEVGAETKVWVDKKQK